MADTHETTADIIAWLRRPREGENAYLTLWRDEIADRFEAALERERGDAAKLREALETARLFVTNCPTPLTTPLVGCGMSRAEVMNIIDAALSAPPRNCDVGTPEEQLKRSGHIANRKIAGCAHSTATTRCCALFAGRRRHTRKEATMDANIKNPQDALEWLDRSIREEAELDGEISNEHAIQLGFIQNMLAKFPRRNCDVGTVKEQSQRFDAFCDEHKYVGDDGANWCSRTCPCYNEINCGVNWAQMPYEEGGVK